jgi:dTMP kinase
LAAGKFITLEGGEGAGKSTQARCLAEALVKKGRDVVLTREPGGAPGAEIIRGLLVGGDQAWDPVTEALLHFAARREHLKDTIRPALVRGAWVVCDRFADSTVAYQGYGLGVDRAIIRRLHRDVVGDTNPDLTLILDIDPADGLVRAGRTRGHDRYERMDLEFHRRLRAGFLAIARREPDRCVVIDASRDLETIESEIVAVVRKRLK